MKCIPFKSKINCRILYILRIFVSVFACSEKFENSSTPNILYIHSFNSAEPLISIILSRYPLLRNLDRNLHGAHLVSTIHTANLVASAASTLITLYPPDSLRRTVRTQPLISPGLPRNSLYAKWTNHRNRNFNESITVFLMSSVTFNFAYCGKPRVEMGISSKFFSDTADLKVWSCLVTCTLAVSRVVAASGDKFREGFS